MWHRPENALAMAQGCVQRAALQLSAAATPVHMVQSHHCRLQKQEARSNLCPTKWLVLAAEVWYLPHTGRITLLTVVM